MSDDSQLLFAFDSVRAARPTGGAGFENLTWAVREGETWAVVGPVAAGKSALADLFAGRLVIRGGQVRWPLLARLRAAGKPVAYPSDLVYRVAFKEDSRLFSYAKHYYQQRFNFVEKDEDLTLDEYLRAGVSAPDAEVQAAADRLGVGHLLGLSFLKLSNGQTRRARIARALLAKPEVLVLDDPYLGVDAAGRAEVGELLNDLVRHGQRFLLIARLEELPDCVTHVLELDRMTIHRQGQRAGESGPLAPRADQSTNPKFRDTRGTDDASRSARGASGPLTEPVIELRDVSVAYDGKPVLDRVTWTVRAGERWAVLGPNGSGKTTLLSLLCGDHPQAYANDIRLFGRRRGTGESIWDIKQRVGLLTPELHLYFTEPLTAAQAAATGFADVVVYRPAAPAQRETVREMFARFGIADLADRPFARLSTGEQRLVLLVRALVKRPPLLILDEPFQGLDRETMARTRNWLDRELAPDQAVLFVTHHADEVPRTVARRLQLDRGRVADRD